MTFLISKHILDTVSHDSLLLTVMGNMEDFSGNKLKANVITVKDY